MKGIEVALADHPEIRDGQLLPGHGGLPLQLKSPVMRMVPFKGIISKRLPTSLHFASGFCRETIRRRRAACRRIVLGEIQANLHGQHVFRLESRIHVLEFLETAQHQSRADKEQNETATWATIRQAAQSPPADSDRGLHAASSAVTTVSRAPAPVPFRKVHWSAPLPPT